MTQSCRGFSATKNSPPSRTKRTLPIKLLHITRPYHLSIDPPSSTKQYPFARSRCGPYLFGLCASFAVGPSLVWSEVPAVLFGRPSSSVRAYAAACGCTDSEEWSAEASRGSGTTTTLLASPRYAYSSSPLQGLSCYSTYGLV